jgi:hypothetical protein
MQATGKKRPGRTVRSLWPAIMLVATPVFSPGPADAAGDQSPGEAPPALPAQAPGAGQAPGSGDVVRRAPKPAAPPSSPDSFTPSERIKADSAVAFPVDI